VAVSASKCNLNLQARSAASLFPKVEAPQLRDGVTHRLLLETECTFLVVQELNCTTI
jgi:hypothetical protein